MTELLVWLASALLFSAVVLVECAKRREQGQLGLNPHVYKYRLDLRR